MKNFVKFSIVGALIALLVCSGISLSVSAVNSQMEQYEIYPIPHSIEYLDETVVISDNVNLYLGKDIDQSTEKHVYDEFSKLDVLVYKNAATTGRTAVYVGVYNSGDIADKFARGGKVNVPSGHFDKIDAYIVAVTNEGILVLGKDTDSAYYGLTTLGAVFSQVENKTVRQFVVYDYSDTQYRGFIEGYYGFPWSTDNRIELMRFGSQFKTNIYIYAPKDDPYHSSNWRGLYSGRDLADLKEQIKAGTETKTRFAWSVHPFMDNEQKMTAENYEESYACLIAKFEQLYGVGVRQFVISADDIVTVLEKSRAYGELHRQLLNDVAEWLREKGDCYSLVFVPTAYSHVSFTPDSTIAGLEYYDGLTENLDETVEIMWTGDKICSRVSNGKFDAFSSYTRGRKAFMWLNWPVNDFDFSHLVLGKGEPLDYKMGEGEELGFTGIVTNPLERAEASKLSIFAVADYCWNINGFDMDESYEDSFKYIEEGATDELHEVCKHLTSTGNYDGILFEESEDLRDDIDAFVSAYENGEDFSVSAKSLIDKFAYIGTACKNYLEKAENLLLKEEIAPWVKSLDYVSQCAAEYLKIALNEEGLNGERLLEALDDADDIYEKATTITVPKLGLPHYTIVKVGNNILMPFVDTLKAFVSDEIKLAAGVFTGNVYKGFGGIEEGTMENITDGDETTFVWLQDHPYKDSYVRIDLGEIVKIGDIKVVTGNADGRDLWTGAAVEYSINGKDYTVAGYLGGENSLIFLDTPVDARYLRLRETDEEHSTWIAIKEVAVNTHPEVTTRVSYGDLKEPAEGTTILGMIDGDKSTYTCFGGGAVTGSYMTLDLLSVKSIKNIRLLMATEEHQNDFFEKTKLEYSVDGDVWTLVGEYTYNSLYIDFENSVEARYVRATQTGTSGKTNWIRVREFAVNDSTPLSVGSGYTNMHSENNGLYNDYTNAIDGDETTYVRFARRNESSDYTIVLDLGEETVVNSVYILSGCENADGATIDLIKTGSVEYSVDGVTWTEISKLDDADGAHQIILDAAVRAKYVRIKNTTGSWVALKEFAINK